jgi:hypothetical protein
LISACFSLGFIVTSAAFRHFIAAGVPFWCSKTFTISRFMCFTASSAASTCFMVHGETIVEPRLKMILYQHPIKVKYDDK